MCLHAAGVGPGDEVILPAWTWYADYDAIEKIALETQPQIIVAGFSAYPFIIDWQRFLAIADKVGAYLLAISSSILQKKAIVLELLESMTNSKSSPFWRNPKILPQIWPTWGSISSTVVF